MAKLIVPIFTGIILFALVSVKGDKNTEVVFTRIREIDRDIMDIRNKIADDIEFAIASFKSGLKQRIKQQVGEAVADILQGESGGKIMTGGADERMVSGESLLELKQLKLWHHQLQRQLQQVMKALKEVRENRQTCVGSLLKDEKNSTEFLRCFKGIIESKILQKDLDQCNKDDSQMKMEVIELKENINALYKSCQSGTATAQPAVESPVEPRIILGPYYSNTRQQFRQLNIHSDYVNNYPYLKLKYALSLAYSSTLRKLFIGLQYPDKVVSSSLGSSGVKTLRYRVQAFGMAVDDYREAIFMTIHKPRKGIARMTTRGKHFTKVAQWQKYSYPWAIAVNAWENKIYVCDLHKVFVVMYDGRHMQTLATGSNIFAITLDNIARNLYYGDDKKLKKISLFNNITSVITTVNSHVRSLVYYDDSVYFSRYSTTWTDYTSIGQIDIDYESAAYTAHPVNVTNALGLVMCLVT